MPDSSTNMPPAGAAEQQCIADGPTTQALDLLAEPLARSAIGVALLAVTDALDTAGAGLTTTVRAHPDDDNSAGSKPIVLHADRSAPFVARLLAIHAALGGRAHRADRGKKTVAVEPARGIDQPWSLELCDAPTALFLTRNRAGEQDNAPFLAVAAEAREYLRYLAAPGFSSRWSAPVPERFTHLSPDRDGLIPADVQTRWQARHAQEACATARLLGDWLQLDTIPADGVTEQEWLHHLGATSEVRPLLTLWFEWLRNHGILAPEQHRLRPGPHRMDASDAPLPPPDEWDQPVKNMVTTLAGHRELVIRVLTGHASASDVLDVEDLRPARLAAAEPALAPVWRQIADLVADHGQKLGAQPALADLGGAAAENTDLHAALNRLGVTCAVLPVGRPPHSAESFDVVLAVGALHRWADPAEGVRAVSSLLRPGGILIALENTELTPLGMLVAGLLENGFTDATGAQIATPTQEAATWTRLLAMAGLTATSTPVGPAPAVLIHAVFAPDPAAEQAEPPTPDNESGPIRSGTEAEIATMWAELLPAAPRTRQDSFFELGGDSLRATRFIAAVQQRYDTTMAMRDLFARPRLAAVADRIDGALARTDDDMEEGVL